MISALQGRVEVNMVDRACSEALTDLNAYYKVTSYYEETRTPELIQLGGNKNFR